MISFNRLSVVGTISKPHQFLVVKVAVKAGSKKKLKTF